MNDRYNKLIWADLSAYNVRKSMEFYRHTFQWTFHSQKLSTTEEYTLAYVGKNAVAGVYEMPEVYQKSQFPPFWMPYIQVSDIRQTVKEAMEIGGAIEVEPTKIDHCWIALIRDPLGAGISLYEGNPSIDKSIARNKTTYDFELHISSTEPIVAFYEKVFQWKLESGSDSNSGRFLNAQNDLIATARVLPSHDRAGYEYWIPVFFVENLANYLQMLQLNSGSVFTSFDDGTIMVCDSLGASFLVRVVSS